MTLFKRLTTATKRAMHFVRILSEMRVNYAREAELQGRRVVIRDGKRRLPCYPYMPVSTYRPPRDKKPD